MGIALNEVLDKRDQLVEALKPFAAWIDDLDKEFPDHEDDVIASGIGDHTITFCNGYLRHLRAALTKAGAIE